MVAVREADGRWVDVDDFSSATGSLFTFLFLACFGKNRPETASALAGFAPFASLLFLARFSENRPETPIWLSAQASGYTMLGKDFLIALFFFFNFICNFWPYIAHVVMDVLIRLHN